MGTTAAREAFYETGLDTLADVGFGGLKLAEVCRRHGVTTGSFYHYFPSWAAYTQGLIAYWKNDRTVKVIDAIRAEADPQQRIATIIKVALGLPHGAEAAIRAWSAVDPDVHRVQSEVDRQRFDVIYDSALEIVGEDRPAEVYAALSLFVFVGYEQSTLPRDQDVFEWISTRMLNDLRSGRFADVPPSG